MILPIISAALLSPFVIEYAFRCWVARKIRTVIESVPPLAITEEPPASRGRRVQWRLPDGRDGHAVVYRQTAQPQGVILFLPELDGTAASAPLYCQPLLDAGFAVVAVEFRDLAADVAPIHWITETEMQRVAATVAYIARDTRLGSLPLGVFGVSRGGTAALLAAQRCPEVVALATDSGYSSMGLTSSFIDRFGRQLIPERLFERLPAWHIRKALWAAFRLSERGRGCRYAHVERESSVRRLPTLMIRGSRDSYVTAAATTCLAERLGEHVDVWTVPRARHNRPRLVAPEEYGERLTRHFRQALAEDVDGQPLRQNVA